MSTGLDDVTFVTGTSVNAPLPQYFQVPPVNPAPGGLWQATAWTEQQGPSRWLIEGVALRSSVTGNFSEDSSSGVWDRDWCDREPSGSGSGQVKEGFRGDDGEPWFSVTCWAADSCDLTAASRAETIARAQQILRLKEPGLAAHVFAERIFGDAGQAVPATDLTGAVGEVEMLFEAHGVGGFIHASPYLRPHLASHVLISRSGAGWVTPGGYPIVFDYGYRAVLGDATMVATSAPIFGWRDQVQVREVADPASNANLAVAERSSLIAVEATLGAVLVLEGPVGPV